MKLLLKYWGSCRITTINDGSVEVLFLQENPDAVLPNSRAKDLFFELNLGIRKIP